MANFFWPVPIPKEVYDCAKCRQREYWRALKVVHKLGLSESKVKAITEEVSLYWIATQDQEQYHHWDWPRDKAASQEVFLLVLGWILFEATDNLTYDNHLELLERGVDPEKITPDMRLGGYVGRLMESLRTGEPDRCKRCTGIPGHYPGLALLGVVNQIQDRPRRYVMGIRKFIEGTRG